MGKCTKIRRDVEERNSRIAVGFDSREDPEAKVGSLELRCVTTCIEKKCSNDNESSLEKSNR